MTKGQRMALHIPVGLGTVFATWVNPILGVLAWASFMGYEWIEDWRIKDHSYLDIAGYSWGLFAGTVLWGFVKLAWA